MKKSDKKCRDFLKDGGFASLNVNRPDQPISTAIFQGGWKDEKDTSHSRYSGVFL